MAGDIVTPPSHDGGVTDVEPADPAAPVYQYQLLLSPSFDAVLEGVGVPVDAPGAVREALNAGRLLLQARGGAGKSVTLQRIAVDAERLGVRVARVWAVEWANQASHGVPLDQATLLAALSSVTDPATSTTVFGDEHETLLLIDGLNEVRGPYVQEMLATVDMLASRYPQLGVVIADRLARRHVDVSSWQLATLTPVPDFQVREILGDAYDTNNASLFGNPFFLERARLDPMTAATHRDFFTAQLGLDPDVLRVLAAAVNRAYRDQRDRLVDVGELERVVGSEVRSLIEAGVLEPAGDRSRFVHHLISDFLAALDLSDDPRRWRRDEFDSLTFTASSFDALALLLDEIAPEASDLLVRSVYDWNLYAAAYMVAEDEARMNRVSTEMRVALLAMLAERRFDRLQATAQQVTDALRLQRTDFSGALLGAASVGEVLQLVGDVEGTSSWFAEWRQLFVRVGDEAGADDIALLRVDDGVLGWTAANVLKRLRLGSTAVEEVMALLREDDDPTVRWRCAHVLGAVPAAATAEALLERARGDDDLWVQYGAVRSLIEVAAGSEGELRERIFLELGGLADAIASTPQLGREVERALHVTDAPAGWAEDAGLLIEQLWARGRSIAEQDRWRELSASLRLDPAAVS